mmetsp:Transcript_9381/g.29942  ORF Transcript_9381/g.29942 Transcript_9381/m.29942 type:complete len:605 (-) Transcript_9381:108-1922(-)
MDSVYGIDEGRRERRDGTVSEAQACTLRRSARRAVSPSEWRAIGKLDDERVGLAAALLEARGAIGPGADGAGAVGEAADLLDVVVVSGGGFGEFEGDVGDVDGDEGSAAEVGVEGVEESGRLVPAGGGAERGSRVVVVGDDGGEGLLVLLLELGDGGGVVGRGEALELGGGEAVEAEADEERVRGTGPVEAEPLARVAVEEAGDEGGGLLGDEGAVLDGAVGGVGLRGAAALGLDDGVRDVGEVEGVVADPPEELVAVRGVPGREAGEELGDEHAEGPEVDGPAVLAAVERLGRHVLGRAAERAAARGGVVGGVRSVEDLREAKVDELDVALRVEEHVLGLEVPVGDAPLVRVVQSARDLRRDEGHLPRLEAPLVLEVPEQLAAPGDLGQQVERVRAAPGAAQLDHVRVRLERLDHSPLVGDVLDLLARVQRLERDRLQRRQAGGVLLRLGPRHLGPLADQVDPPERAVAQLRDGDQVARHHLLLHPLRDRQPRAHRGLLTAGPAQPRAPRLLVVLLRRRRRPLAHRPARPVPSVAPLLRRLLRMVQRRHHRRLQVRLLEVRRHDLHLLPAQRPGPRDAVRLALLLLLLLLLLIAADSLRLLSS